MTKVSTNPRAQRADGQSGGPLRDSQLNAGGRHPSNTRRNGEPSNTSGLAQETCAPPRVNPLRQPEFDLQIGPSFRPVKPSPELWATAIHEAGHAVVAVYYEIPISEVTVQPDGEGGIDLDREKIEPRLSSPVCVRYLSKQVAMGYSGFIAQLKVHPAAAVDWRGGVEDWEANKEWLCWLWDCVRYERRFRRKTPAEWRLTKAQVERIIHLRARRLKLIARRLVDRLFPVIQLVASALIERQRLTGDEVAAIAEARVAFGPEQ